MDVDRLARAARDGDRAALARFLSAIQGDIWRFCAHLTRRDDADDLAQEALLRVVSHLHRWQGDSAMAWSVGIARNVCLDHLRRKARRRRTGRGLAQGAAMRDVVDRCVPDHPAARPSRVRAMLRACLTAGLLCVPLAFLAGWLRRGAAC